MSLFTHDSVTAVFWLGMLDISKDPDYSKIYDKLPRDEPGDTDMLEETRFFMSHVDNLSTQITMLQVLPPYNDPHNLLNIIDA